MSERIGSDFLIAPTADEMSRLVNNICPRCGERMVRKHDSPVRPTRDHILPVMRGGGVFIHGNVPNYRLMCAECNGLLSMCGHCPGAVAAVRDVARQVCVLPKGIAARWGMEEVAKKDGGRRAKAGKENGERWHRRHEQRRSYSQSVLAPSRSATFGDIWPKSKVDK